MASTINSHDQPAPDLGPRKSGDGFAIEKNDRLQRQWEFGHSADKFAQLKEGTRIQDQRFFDPVVDFVRPSSVYLIPVS